MNFNTTLDHLTIIRMKCEMKKGFESIFTQNNRTIELFKKKQNE